MAGSAGVTLLSNASASSGWVDWPGGLAVFSVAGTFGGCTVTLNILGPDGSTAIPASATQGIFTAAGSGQLNLPPGQVQAQVSGGAPSGLYATLARVVS